MMNRTNPTVAMAYSAPAEATGPFGAVGQVINVEARVKAKKAGGTFTINVATLDTGAEVEFGFKPCPARIGDRVSWQTQKQYGTYRFVSDDPGAGAYMPALPPRGAYVPPSAPGTSAPPASSPPAYRPGSAKPFPLPRDHGDTAIIRQNALTNAVKTITDALSTSNAKGDCIVAVNTIEELEQRIIQTAYKFTAFSSGHLDAILADDIAKSAAGK